ncbi:MAG: ABC transporter permease [Acidimicrobiia bacterium]|nr:ABC transporter permease [Acidimicrobiia bacterium]
MRSRLRVLDSVLLGLRGLASRTARTILTATGIAIGIAAIVAVLGISASGRADLLATLDNLGTNLLRVEPGSGIFGTGSDVPEEAAAMTGRIRPVEQVTQTTRTEASVRRNDLISELETKGITVLAADLDLIDVLRAELAEGRFIDAATSQVPTVVLGDVAAKRLGIVNLDPVPRVYVNDTYFTVIGILEPMEIHPDIERSVVIGYPVAAELFETTRSPTSMYVRSAPDFINDVAEVIPATVNPEQPDAVQVSRPSDALEARKAADEALTNLLIGLGAVALLVAGVAIANIMVISVLERRMEIGVRRAIGATRGHIRIQFLIESMMLAGIGGVLGMVLGAAITVGYAASRNLTVAVPPQGLALSVLAALAIGAVAGLYPAIRASRIPPAEAVRK